LYHSITFGPVQPTDHFWRGNLFGSPSHTFVMRLDYRIPSQVPET